jgi:hypothetical protein
MPLNKKEINILKKNGWEVACKKPLEFVRYAQFAGGVHRMDNEEDMRAEIRVLKDAEEYKKYIQKRDASDVHITKLKATVKELLTVGITEKTLLDFLNAGKDCMDHHGDTYIAEHYEEFFKEVFDEVDPP